jgi:hypothetical protein
LKIATAMPDLERDRQRMRELADPMPIPARYVTGAVTLPCSACAMPLNVGPRVAEQVEEGVTLVCPFCLFKFSNGEFDIEHLGNPDSHWEGEQ